MTITEFAESEDTALAPSETGTEVVHAWALTDDIDMLTEQHTWRSTLARAELPTSPGAGALHITATDHRSDPDSVCGLLWSNTQRVRARTGPG
jgi:hypothetical protein